jgi:hypothetical protein
MTISLRQEMSHTLPKQSPSAGSNRYILVFRSAMWLGKLPGNCFILLFIILVF